MDRDITGNAARPVFLVFAACLLCAVAVRYASFFPSVMDPDESLYLVMAQHWLRGELPYETVWDQHSVGLPAFFAAIQAIFPKSIVAIRLSAAAAVAVTATAIYFISRLIDRYSLASTIAAALYIAKTTRSWGFPANCELYLNALIVPAMLLVLRQLSGQSRARETDLYVGALLLGVGLQVKHVIVFETMLFFALALVAVWPSPRRWHILSIAAACCAFPSLLVLVYFCANGLLDEYLRAVVFSNLIYAGSPVRVGEILHRVPSSHVAFSLLCTIVAGGLIVGRRDKQAVFVLLWAVAAWIDVVLPGQYWPHYFVLSLPATCILVGYLATFVRETGWRDQFPRLTAVSLFVLAIAAINPLAVYRQIRIVHARAQEDVPRMVAREIGAQITADDHVFVVDYQPIVYWLTAARLPTNHVLPMDWSPLFAGTTGVNPSQELQSVFSFRPRFVVVTDKNLISLDSPTREMLERFLSAYEPQSKIRDNWSMPEPVLVTVYRRKPGGEGQESVEVDWPASRGSSILDRSLPIVELNSDSP